MKVDFTQEIHDIYGKPIPNGLPGAPTKKNEHGMLVPAETLTLRAITVHALTATYEGEDKLGFAEKQERWKLATRIQKRDSIDLKSEQIVKIKELINKAYGTAIVGPAFALIEPEEDTDESAAEPLAAVQ